MIDESHTFPFFLPIILSKSGAPIVDKLFFYLTILSIRDINIYVTPKPK